MCQAYAGERSYVSHMDERLRRIGYDAFLSGTPRSEIEQLSNDYDKKQQLDGYDTAAANREFW